MEFGISLLPDVEPETRSAATYYRDTLALCRMADEAGLGYVKMTEHYLHPYGGYCPSPLAFLSAVAAQTSRIRLMTGGVIPNYHHPIQLASHISMVDALSEGRLDVGFARGYLPYEYDAFGVPMNESLDRFKANISTMIHLWEQEDVSVDSPYFSFQHATVLPRPTQAPHPPLWAAAVRTPQSFEWIGQMGMGLLITPTLTPMADIAAQTALYREAFAARHGDSGLRPRIAMSVPLFVADTDDEATHIGDELMAEYFRVWFDATDSWNVAWSKDYPAYTGMSHFLRGMSPTSWREAGSGIVGSVEHVVERIQEIHEAAAPDVLLLQVDFGAAAGDLAARNLRTFTERVLPKVIDL